MKTKQIKLSVPKPCHEDWNKITPKDKGAFCGSCAKIVVDFTKMSDRELISFLEKSKGEKTCGKFNPYQLERKIVATTPTPNYFIQFKKILAGLFFGLSFPALTKAIEIPRNPLKTVLINDSDQIEKTIIKGTVYAANGDVLVGAAIQVFISGRITHFNSRTDKLGNFEIAVPLEGMETKVSIKVSAKDFFDNTVDVVVDEFVSVSLDHVYKSNPMVLGKMAIVSVESPKECGVKDKMNQNEGPFVKGEILTTNVNQLETEEADVSEEIFEEIDIMGDVAMLEVDQALPIELNGKVVNEFGEALPFANVLIQNTELGAMTDIDGIFKLNILENLEKEKTATLIFSAIGYKTQELIINSSESFESEYNVVLQMEILEPVIRGLMIYVPHEDRKPNSFDANYQEPDWKEKGFSSKKEYVQYIKMNP